MKPVEVKYIIGMNAYNQPIRMTLHVNTVNQMVWQIRREAANQRDDVAIIDGLTDDNILAMADAVQAEKGHKS
jgi:hypothetical protein